MIPLNIFHVMFTLSNFFFLFSFSWFLMHRTGVGDEENMTAHLQITFGYFAFEIEHLT